MVTRLQLGNTVQLITGAGSGLGRSAAKLFAAQGAALVCIDRDWGSASGAAKAITDSGGDALAIEADVTDEASMASAVNESLKRFGAVHGLFANAGLPGMGSALDLDMAEWHRTIAVNLTGALISARAVLPPMLAAEHGTILFTASVSGLKAFPRQADYAASKGGVIALARQMSLDYASAGIRVNSICPGTIVTPLVDKMYAEREKLTGTPRDELLASMSARFPLGTMGVPEDVAAMAAFLQSAQAGWVTGQAFTVDGGITA